LLRDNTVTKADNEKRLAELEEDKAKLEERIKTLTE
jgi:hypothetical protein